MRSSPVRVNLPALITLTACIASAAGARAQLATSSPFLPESTAPVVAAPTEDSGIELTGVMDTPGGMRFGILETGRNMATWVSLNETGNDFVVRSHRLVDGRDQVTVDYRGTSLVLAAKVPQVASAATRGTTGRGGFGGRAAALPAQTNGNAGGGQRGNFGGRGAGGFGGNRGGGGGAAGGFGGRGRGAAAGTDAAGGAGGDQATAEGTASSLTAEQAATLANAVANAQAQRAQALQEPAATTTTTANNTNSGGRRGTGGRGRAGGGGQ